MSNLLGELKRRNVIRVGVLYAVAAWLLLQVTDVLVSILELPAWSGKLVFLFLAVGFPIVLIFSWVYELTPEGIKREKDVERSESVTGETARKLNVATVVVVLLGIGAVVVDRLLPRATQDRPAPVAAVEEEPLPAAPATPAEPRGAEAGPEGNSIAVLPFVNMSGDPDNEYFADGLTEELLNVLAKMEGLRVAARTSSFRFKGQVGDVADIGRQLRVGNVLEGSVRKSGDKIRVTAQLIQVEDGFHLWSETYDRQMEDIFVIQDDIASHVGEALKVTLLGQAADVPATPRAPTRNIEAYTAYLRGQQQLAVNSYDSFEKAEGLFKDAIALDPGFGAAHSGLAKTWAMMSDWGALPRSETVPRVAAEAQRALDVDERDPLGWAMRGWAEFQRSDLSTTERQASNERAETHLRRALEIEPGHVDASQVLTDLLTRTQRPEEALAVAEAALSRDLVSAKARVTMADSLRALSRFDEARAQLQLARELEPDDPMPIAVLTMVEEASGNYAASIPLSAEMVTAFDSRDPEGPASLAMSYLVIGDLEAAEVWVRKGEAMDADVPAVRFARAMVLWFGGRRDEAFEMARTAVEEDLDSRMGSNPGFNHMIAVTGLQRGDFDLALLPYEDWLDEALDPEADWSPTSPSFARAMALPVLRARGDGALAEELGRRQLEWLDSGESGLGEIARASVRAITLRGLGRVEEALAQYRWLLDKGGAGAVWRLFYDFEGIWLNQEDHPALKSYREEVRAWQAQQRKRLAESGREPPMPATETVSTET